MNWAVVISSPYHFIQVTMASATGHSSRAQLYKKCSAKSWPNKTLAEGSTSSFTLRLPRLGKHQSVSKPLFGSSAFAYAELVPFPFCSPLPKTAYVSVQNTCILPIPGLGEKQAGKISSEAARTKLTNPQVNLLQAENCEKSPPTPRLMPRSQPSSAEQGY